jgi:hypothetical protein
MNLGERPLVSRATAEVATAAILFCIGAAIVVGALEFQIGWDESGPQPGYFPFRVGLVVMLGALGSAVTALLHREWRGTVWLTDVQVRRVASFFGPVVAFVALCNVLGLYAAMALYLVFTTRFQGGYGWVRSLGIGLGTAVAFFVLFEFLFGQPLLKGPIEGLLGFH